MTTTRTDYLDDMRACAEAIDLQPAAFVTPEDRWVELNGVNFHYLDWGNDHLPHLVLLHGGSLTAPHLGHVRPPLRDRYHVVALDQRGHGDTGWTPDDQLDQDNGDLMLEDTRAFLDLGRPASGTPHRAPAGRGRRRRPPRRRPRPHRPDLARDRPRPARGARLRLR